MKKLLFITFLSFLVSCDNGDIEVPSFDFESTIYSCNENSVLYRANTDKTEVLILQLAATDFLNTTGEKFINITAENCNYRLFDGEFSTTYFCADVPDVTPVVSKNWNGVAGTSNVIHIHTVEVEDKTKTENKTVIEYEHHITLQNLVLESDGEKLTYTTYDFGKVYTN